MSNKPQPGAKSFVINDHQIVVWVNQIFESEYGLRTVYKKGEDYIYIAEPSLFLSEITTKEATDAVFDSVISEINDAIKLVFSKKDVEPSAGIERVRWLLENKTFVINNELERKL